MFQGDLTAKEDSSAYHPVMSKNQQKKARREAIKNRQSQGYVKDILQSAQDESILP